MKRRLFTMLLVPLTLTVGGGCCASRAPKASPTEPTPGLAGDVGEDAIRRLTPDEATTMTVAYLPIPTVGWAIGHSDGRVFHRWAGVTLRAEWVRPPGSLSGPATLDPLRARFEVPVDPPLDYRMAEAGFAAVGYYDSTMDRFFEWRDVRCRPERVGADVLGVRREPSFVEQFDVLIIEVPEHRRALADYLNATAR